MPLAVPPRVEAFLHRLKGNGFAVVTTGSAGMTYRIRRGVEDYGYVNGTVLKRDAVLGYHFRESGRRGSDSCPAGLELNLVDSFCRRYGCAPGDLDALPGNGANSGRLFLHVRDPEVALKILEADANAID
jgi:hypothetical protein